MAAEHPPEFVVVSLKDIQTSVTKDRVWFGFPHYVVLGWALLVSYTLYSTVTRLDTHLVDGDRTLSRLNETNTTMAQAITVLQIKTQELREDSIRTRMILELKFPQAARQVDDAFDFDVEGDDR